jgi:hypothetical protein
MLPGARRAGASSPGPERGAFAPEREGPGGVKRQVVVAFLGLASWGITVVLGFVLLLDYQFAQGESLPTPAEWPPGTGVVRDPGRPTLLIFLHPRCPCSEASLEELARLLARVPGRATAMAILVKPPGARDAWEEGEIGEGVLRIPGVRLVVDTDGAEARRFGMRTSGAVAVYDAGGRLVFSGGITAARGHRGDSTGSHAILSLLDGNGPGLTGTPVFGCPLFSPPGAGSDHPCAE